MFSSRDAFENDFCPVREDLLGEMYRANENGLPQLVESVSSEVRAMLALFCYRRSKLQRARTDPIGRPRRFHAVCAVARSTGHALIDVVGLWQSQADHTVDQAAQHVLAG